MVQHKIKSLLFLFVTFTAISLGHSQEAPCVANIDDNGGGGTLVKNYTNFAPIVRNSSPTGNVDFYRKYYTQGEISPQEARKLLASLYSIQAKPWVRKSSDTEARPTDCSGDMEKYLKENTPDVYIYVGGFGSKIQLNDTYIDAADVVKWVNERGDKKSLVISLGWSCDDAQKATDQISPGKRAWCKQKADEYAVTKDNVIYKTLLKRTLGAPSKDAPEGQVNQTVMGQLDQAAVQYGAQYNESLTHSLEMASYLVKIILSASADNPDPLKGKIHFIGYSLGAQIVTEIMSFDYNSSDNKEGFPWNVRGACENGEKICRVSELKKVKWGLAMGTPGWTPAIRNSRNGFDELTGVSTRDPKDRDQYQNGGITRVKDATYRRFTAGTSPVMRELKYNKKLVIVNKRYDPTSYADDTYQRGVGSSLLAEYNHYGHDYIRPFFWSKTWLNTVEKYLENPNVGVSENKEWGIVWEAGANFDFEDCEAASCNPISLYSYHPQGVNSHGGLTPMKPKTAVTIVSDAGNKAVSFEKSNDQALQAYAMDQEDLRGSVEFSWKPSFDLNSAGTKGLFSYGSCDGSSEELMPQAYVKDGKLIFEVKYQRAEPYTVSINLASADSLIKKGEWTHVSFGWDMQTKTIPELMDKESGKTKYGDAYFYAAGLLKPVRTSLRAQKGVGKMSIYINGKEVVSGDLGDDGSERECLPFAKVINPSQGFDLFGFNRTLPAYNPFTGYENDTVANSNGTNCKAYRVRNTPVFFGCAKSATASSQMDNVRLIFGSPRTSFPEINTAGGLPKAWTEVLGI